MADSVLERVAMQVRLRPEAPALVVNGEHSISYVEMWQRCTDLAGHLQELGLGPGERLGLHLERSPDFIFGMLASWMCGASFVPMGPLQPKEGLKRIVNECDLRCVLGSGARPSWLSPRRRYLDASSSLKAVRVRTLRPKGAEDEAYVIYTSGSTGLPKGVRVGQRGLVAVLDAQVAAWGLSGESRILWMLSPSFDASQSDVGTALLAGACLYLERAEELAAPENLMCLLVARGITHVDVPPSLLPFLAVGDRPASLQSVVIGGEVCTPVAVRRWAKVVRLFNVYGPTEATICCSMIECDPDWRLPMLGGSVADAELLVCDNEGEAVGIGEVGELCIAGPSLALGYVQRPQLERQKFVLRQGKRVYRTGDQVRVRPEGLEFLGRLDRQFKLRGMLVAPEEIEKRLIEYPGVLQALVLSEGDPGHLRIAAYIVSQADVGLGDLRAYLRRHLPAFMVPQRVHQVARLPTNGSGKLERKSVPAMDPNAPNAVRFQASAELEPSEEGASQVARHLVDSRDSTEGNPAWRGDLQQVAMSELWCEILDLESVGPKDDFFALGGDSMAIIKLIVAAERRGWALSIEAIHRHPQLDELVKAALEPASLKISVSCEELRNRAAQWVQRVRAAAPTPIFGSEYNWSSSKILLSGATGFLGVRVLHELLQRDEAEVVVLVRAADAARARDRVHGALEGAGLPNHCQRVQWLPGDLRCERFGLSLQAWEVLTTEVAEVYHCAAAVNLLEPYAHLESTNVGGTARVLQFAHTNRPKVLHYASTLSVFVAAQKIGPRVCEADSLCTGGAIYGGYAQSKWVAEELVREVCAESLGGGIYRFGLLTGDLQTGRVPEGDWLSMFVRGLAGGAEVPEQDMQVDMTPVDYAAAAMVHLALNRSPGPLRYFHIANKRAASIRDISASVAKLGLSGTGSEIDSAVARLGMCRSGHSFDVLRPCDVFQATGVSFDTSNAENGLRDSGITCPEPGPDLIDFYVQNMLAEEVL